MKKKDVKIFVSHRIDLDSETVKSPVYIPVRCGAVYDDRKIIPDIAGDDSGDNISEKRGSYCELTVQYWAWKNVKAEYYGLCHYRRYLSFSENEFKREPHHQFQVPEALLSKKTADKYNLCDTDRINKLLEENDLIIPLPWDVSGYEIPGVGKTKSVYDLWKFHEGIMSAPGCTDLIIKIIENKFPQYKKAAKEYLSGKYSWSSNCFIMQKNLFNEMCEFEFSVLEELDRKIDSSLFGTTLSRTPGYMAEVLSGIFFKHCQLNNCRINQRQLVLFLDTDREITITPKWKDAVTIAIPASDYYSPYLSVTLQSILDHADNEKNYDIIVLYKTMSEQNKKLLNLPFLEKKNMRLSFYNVKQKLDGINLHCAPGMEESNFKLLAPWILKKYKKAIIMDADIVLKTDIANLFDNAEFKNGKLIYAVKDGAYQGMLNGAVVGEKEYAKKVMKMKNPYNYVNAGVFVFDLSGIREFVSEEKLIDYANTHRFNLQEQTLINVFFEKKIDYLSIQWNFYIKTNPWVINALSLAPVSFQKEYNEAEKNPYLLHFANQPKPWDAPDSYMAHEFWTVARKTVYYEQILSRFVDKKFGNLHSAVYNLQVQHGLFEDESQVMNFVNNTFPLGSKRRNFAKFLVPKNSLRWKFCKKIYHLFRKK